MMKFFRFLLFIVLINTLSADNSWILPRSTSFHHALELFHARVNIPTSLSSFKLSSLLSFANNNTICRNDLLLLTNGFLKQEKWALKIIDSWGIKPPAGILEGAHLWLGSYDECLHSLYLLNNKTYVTQPYPTKYCTISNKNNDSNDQFRLQNPGLIVGICLPKSCDSNDFQFELVIK